MFDQVVFAGGGNRCWWQAGFWDVIQPELNLRPRVVAGISAGAATACMLYTNESRWVMRYYAEALRENRKNAYWGNLLRGSSRTAFTISRKRPRSASVCRICRAGSARVARWRRV
ncbi:patatin-like phospholipase [Caballeronia catudaia]|uniref:Patatin-like phospholipase n=1 Tax=Caballeronia catudaia TaxID=1777136 RepID=A0A157Z483_9BURK|nr:patatin-like phospholipase [Caballeronia catudaia]